MGLPLAASVALTACVSGGGEPVPEETPPAQPASAVYLCEGGAEMLVENSRSTVHVVSPRGVEVDLPASPPSQESRYGSAPYALVLEDREALWMVTGKEPIGCRR